MPVLALLLFVARNEETIYKAAKTCQAAEMKRAWSFPTSLHLHLEGILVNTWERESHSSLSLLFHTLKQFHEMCDK